MTPIMIKNFKKIYDPIHGFIKFDDNEKQLINSFPFQRLHYIHQLGGAYLVFPGAVHSRFEHSLGVMDIATRVYDKICENIRPDLFDLIPRKRSFEYLYWKKILRLAALCHDLGHLPFSHVAEKDLLGELGHEEWTFKIIKSSYLKEIFENIQKDPIFQGNDIVKDIIKVSIGEKALKKIDVKENYQFSCWDKILYQIIAGDFFGVDRIDYLLRDSKFTGVGYGFFDYLQLIEMIRVLPKNSKDFELGIDEKGIESCEALIVARYFMYKRVYQNPTVLAYNFHIKRFIKKINKKKNFLKDIDSYLMVNDADIISDMNIALRDVKNLGYKDAINIILRKKRFRAVPISFNVLEKDLVEFKRMNSLKDFEMEWEINKKKEIEISFPVLKKLAICKAKDCSFLLSKMAYSQNNWVYIIPEYEVILSQFLKL